MNRCPHYCKFTSDINIDEEEPVTNSIHYDNEEHLSLEDGDQLFTLDVDGYLENNRTNYDYVLKYNPTKSKMNITTMKTFSPRKISINFQNDDHGIMPSTSPLVLNLSIARPTICRHKSKKSSRSLL